MLLKFLVVAFVVASNNVDGQPCSVCGEGKTVTKLDDIFTFGPSPVPCGELQAQGQTGQIPADSCAQLSAFIGPGTPTSQCGCAPGTLPPISMETLAPVAPPTETGAPAAPPTEPEPGTEAPITEAPIAPTEAPIAPTEAPIAPTAPPTEPPTLGTAIGEGKMMMKMKMMMKTKKAMENMTGMMMMDKVTKIKTKI
jgi:hypothetical protein